MYNKFLLVLIAQNVLQTCSWKIILRLSTMCTRFKSSFSPSSTKYEKHIFWLISAYQFECQVMYTTANYCSSLAANLSIFQGFKISFYLTFLCVTQFARECFHADFQISRFPDHQAKIHVSKLTTSFHICMFPHF